MDMKGKRQAPSIFGGMGFYIALLVCVVAAGVVGYFALSGDDPAPTGSTDPLQNVDNTTPGDTVPVTQTDKKDTTPVLGDEPIVVSYPDLKPSVEADNTETISDNSEEPPTGEPVSAQTTPSETDVAEPAPVVNRIVAPLNGETVSVFSVDQLSYDETLGDWRTHDGIDIRAEAGTPVVATTAGTVLSVDEDGRLGVTVCIEHDGGYVTTYASLHPETHVEVGQEVEAGDMIGTVGNTSLSEAALGAHLHFSVPRNGKAIDPMAYLPKES